MIFNFTISHFFQIFLFISLGGHTENFILDVGHFCELADDVGVCTF